MQRTFKVGDHVTWNSEAGRVSGKIVKVHTKDLDYKGYTHHASRDDPQYEIKSDKTDHVALRKAAVLRRARHQAKVANPFFTIGHSVRPLDVFMLRISF